MDDTTQSRTSDAAAAAATRKRRSSILKSQRPPRTPFSELEFNVATPTDTAKSRRVSFSRRTGVAEFVTNEATTTWKNFYEEQNKSLESSGNESAANQPRQQIGHIGKRMFDQQFEEVEAVDYISTLGNHSNNINCSLNNVNFTAQIASLECTGDDRKLPAPQQNFEMSAFTDHTLQNKLFGDDINVPTIGEMTGGIDVNFSAMQTIGGEVKDDLDEIQKDLQRAQNNFICRGPFKDRNISEYIEVDLNTTHVTIRNDESDMSITDTIHSPKVQDVSKSNSLHLDKKPSSSKDWVADKENIALNPYVAPKETANFAINDESDKILVFDGKKLTVKSDKEADAILKTDEAPQEPIKQTHHRKTIVLNLNDDLPNFIDDPHTSFKHSVMYDDDISITQPLPNKDLIPSKTINESNFGNISITQAVPAQIIVSKNNEKRKTIVFENDDGNISMTQALPAKVIANQDQQSEMRKTILYENDIGDISITQAIPSNKIIEKLLLDENDDLSNVVSDLLPTLRKSLKHTVVYDDKDISITQPVNLGLVSDTNMIKCNKEAKNVNESHFGNLSITQAISAKIIVNKNAEKRKTIVYENDDCNISMTQALPANIIANANTEKNPERRRTILYENDTGDISITQAVPVNKILVKPFMDQNYDKIPNPVDKQHKPDLQQSNIIGKTIVYDDDISTTQPLVNKINWLQPKIVDESNSGNISMTQAIPAQIIISKDSEKRKTVVYDNDDYNISMTHVLPANIIDNLVTQEERRKTILYENETGDVSITQVIPTNKILEKSLIGQNLNVTKDLSHTININNISKHQNQDVFVFQAVTTCNETAKDIQPDNAETEDMSGNVVREKSVLFKDTKKSNSIIHHTSLQMRVPEKQEKERDSNESLHPKNFEDIEHVSPGIHVTASEKSRKTILDDLLNMSQSSLQPVADEKLVLVKKDDAPIVNTEKISRDSIVHIVTDIKSETQINKNTSQHHFLKSPTTERDTPRIDGSSVSSLLHKTEKDSELKSSTQEKTVCEKVQSPEIDNNKCETNEYEKLDVSKPAKSFRDANDTNELLEMLSDLTDKQPSVQTVSNRSQINEVNEPRRLSVPPSRLSIVLSREDLLNNISMAQAALQMSIQTDESLDSSDTQIEESLQPKKTNRVSNEVVKKLQFEDESTESIRTDMKSPLKKTAFDEVSYIKESKAQVIPSYLKDVSDGLKSLMSDLIKPNADTIPFQSTGIEGINEVPSTCSTQVQANLVTSSQIDINTETNSVTSSSINDTDKVSVASSLALSSSCHKRPPKITEKQSPLELSFRPRRIPAPSAHSDRVVFFDHENPLNNVLLIPCEYSEAHKYNPAKTSEELCADENEQGAVEIKENTESEDQPKQYNVGCVSFEQKMNFENGHMRIAQSAISNLSKPASVDESISTRISELKDTKVNTHITMKTNQELLEASSSLTLVDDAVAQNALDTETDFGSEDDFGTKSSNFKVIYQNNDHKIESELSDMTSNETETESMKSSKGMKRIYSPSVKGNVSIGGLDITPKPISKMQKLSNSPADDNPNNDATEKLTADKDVPEKEEENVLMDVDSTSDCKEMLITKEEVKQKSPSKTKHTKNKKPGSNITVQQLIAEFNVQTEIDQNALNKQILEALSRTESLTAPEVKSVLSCQSPDIVSSFTSSKDQREMQDTRSVSSANVSQCSKSRQDWQPELMNESSSKNLVSECESSVNVVAKIDMLPFMGSHECEWEASGMDTWSFRLLHSRLRLTMKLAHRHENAARTRVRADTPVLAVALETTHTDKKNSVAAVCISFAADAMRYYVGRGCGRAGEAPALLRRLAAVARVAARWGRAMHDARQHLAYTLTGDGGLALKVANIPLRSVWEVTMRLELVVDDAREIPCPRACDVRVTRVVSDVTVSDDEVRRVLAHVPRDWGHVPRTIWKIFRYLKNKSRDNELLGF